MIITLKQYLSIVGRSVYLSDNQRITPPHSICKGAVSLLFAVILTIAFCSCGKDDIPSTQSTDSPLSRASIEQIVPNSRWQLAKLLYTAGDVEFNAAWKEMEVEFTRDSAFFYRRDLVYDPISHTSVPEITLSAKCQYSIKTPKITFETTVFDVISSDSTSIILVSPTISMHLSRTSQYPHP